MSAVREFPLPDLGEGLTDAELVSWSVAVGERVEVDQTLCEVETAKAIVDLPSPFAGTVSARQAEQGDTVTVGAPLVTIDADDDSPGGGEPAEPAQEAHAPDGAPPATLVGSGPLARHPARAGWRRRSAARAASGRPAPRTPATPAARKAARETGVDVDAVAASRADGVVTEADVARAGAEQHHGTPPGAAAPAAPGGSADAASAVAADRSTPSVAVRRATARTVSRGAREIPHASAFRRVDVTASTDLLDKLRGQPDFRDVRLTPLTVVANAVLVALRKDPIVNSAWDEEAEAVVERRTVDLGIAVAGDRGLTVPHIRAADRLGLRGLARALTDLVDDARTGRSTPADLAAGTFSITNIGVFGLDAGTAIITPGESAVLSLGTVAPAPWVDRGAIAVRTVATLGLSFDHRIIDGAQAGRFLAVVADVLANPLRLAD